MRLPKFATAGAGQWVPRPDPAPDAEPPFSTARAACTLQSGDQVLVTETWRTVDRTERLPYAPEMPGPSQWLLYLADGGVLGTAFDYVYTSRDEDEQALAAGGAA